LVSLIKTKLQAMLNRALLNPGSVVVVGASNNRSKPGGHLLSNMIEHAFNGQLYVVNPNEKMVQGVRSFSSVKDLPLVDLAILAIPARFCVEVAETLAATKQTKAFIVISAGFGEADSEGKALEERLLQIMAEHEACLIGPNCIGLITSAYAGVFTSPVPMLDPRGIDFVSGSGATAVFTMEAGMSKGLRFASVFSVGNSAQIGVEEVLEYWDENFDAQKSPHVKLLYLESIRDSRKLLRHARSLVTKGCRIAAVKAGVGESGTRAAQSHTGALVSSDLAVDALFRKAGIVRCYGREELTTVAAIFLLPELKGTSFAVITHAGGPAVMLADALEKGGFSVPWLTNPTVKSNLKSKLFPGSSVENPIDFLATGTAEQLSAIIDTCEQDIPEVDAMIVIFGSPGLRPVHQVYRMLSAKMGQCRKPVFPVLPSVVNAWDAIAEFIDSGNVCFPGEVELAEALIKVKNTPKPETLSQTQYPVDTTKIQAILSGAAPGFLDLETTQQILEEAGIPYGKQQLAETEEAAVTAAVGLGFPVAMKVVGPIHKTDVGGVLLNVGTEQAVVDSFRHLMAIPGSRAVSIGKMVSGPELFIGVKRERGFDPIVLFGLGGIWIELVKDLQYGLPPLSIGETVDLIKRLKAFPLLKGFRGQKGISILKFAELIVRVSDLALAVPQIYELELNPIIADGENFQAVDVRMKLEIIS